MDRDNPLMESAIFGREVQAFLNTSVGKYLVAKAEEEAQAATAELKRVLPFRWRRITQLQTRIYRAESVQKWLGEAIMDGVHAEKIITGEDDNG